MLKIRFLLLQFAFSLSLHAQDLISHKPPVYPLAAKAAGIEGPSRSSARFLKKERRKISAISGPPELRQAAIDAVSNWTYKPYRHFGHIVTVDTTVTVNFLMARTPVEKAEVQAKQKRNWQRQQPSKTHHRNHRSFSILMPITFPNNPTSLPITPPETLWIYSRAS